MSTPKGTTEKTTSDGASKQDDSQVVPEGAETRSKPKKKRRVCSEDSVKTRTSITDYERIELREGRLDPLFYVFWREYISCPKNNEKN